MRSDRKINDNKHNFDPGRLGHKIEFFEQTSVDDGFGCVVVTETLVLTTKCSKAEVSLNAITQARQIGLIADETEFSQVQYFIIRNRKEFYPVKDMTVDVDGVRYVINGVQKMDDPVTYLRLLCSKI